MPVATAGAMKGLTFEHLRSLHAEILLCNTFHMHMNPGEKIVEDAGGLQKFIDWDKSILTDSGGFQVFSLSKLRKMDDDGVTFQSPRNGDELRLTPESAMEIQHRLGSDIIMCLDHCPPSTAEHSEIADAVRRTVAWAKRCKVRHAELCKERGTKPLLFGIVQGGLDQALRSECAKALQKIGFDGYAIGGLAVGETPEEMFKVLEYVCPLLPTDAPRYLMGVGRTEQMEKAVALGVDMFDCVLPMREARHGRLFLSDGSTLKISNAQYQNDHSVIDANSPSPLSQKHLKSYLHHLSRIGERYFEVIACLQNVSVTLLHMKNLRERILQSK